MMVIAAVGGATALPGAQLWITNSGPTPDTRLTYTDKINTNFQYLFANMSSGGGATNAVTHIQGQTNAQIWFALGTNNLVPTISTNLGTNTIDLPYSGPVRHGILNSNDFLVFVGKQGSNSVLGSLSNTRAVTNVASTFGVLVSDILYAPATIHSTNLTNSGWAFFVGDVTNNGATRLQATLDVAGVATFTDDVNIGASGGFTALGGATIGSVLMIPNGAAPTTDAFGEIAGDNNAWAAGRGALQIYDGTANTYAVATLASDTPSNGQVPKWNTGGTITWEDDSGAGSDATKVATNNGTAWGLTLRGTIDRPVTAPTAVGGVVIFDFTNTANMFYTMNSNVTFVVSNLTTGGRGTITITNTGSFIGTWSQFNSNNWAGRYVPAVPPNYWCVVEVSRSKTDGTMTNLVMSGSEAPITLGLAVTDETTSLTTGNGKITFRMPHAMTLSEVRANLNTVSSSGIPTVDINEGGVTILSTKLTIDANEKTSITAATPPVISDASLADDAEITVDIDVAGTGAKGLKIWLIGTRPF